MSASKKLIREGNRAAGTSRKKGSSKRRPMSKTGQKPKGYVKRPDDPKPKREHQYPARSAPAMVDCMKTLGHPPRGRTGRGKRRRR